MTAVPTLPGALQGEAAAEWLGGFPASTVRFPGSPEDVAALVGEARSEGRSLAPAGAGTWLAGGGWVREADEVLSVRNLSSTLHYEPADLTLTVGAGMLWADLEEMLGAHGQWLPLDPPGVGAGTVGGVVSAGASGSLRTAYGAVRDNVLGVHVVTGEGKRLALGGRVVKNVAGYDLVRLLTGSRGSLGVITAVSLRLYPLPERDVTLRFRGAVPAMVRAAREVASLPVPLASIELDCGGEEQDDDGELLVRMVGSAAEVAAAAASVRDATGGHPCTGETVVEDGESRALHALRTRWERGSEWVIRCSALAARLEHTVNASLALAGALGGEATAHVAQGVVRVRAGRSEAGPREPSDTQGDGPQASALTAALSTARKQLEDLGGRLRLTTSPPGWTGAALPPSPAVSAIQQRIKALFDPGGVFGSEPPVGTGSGEGAR